jgi:hypothetical protein
MVTKIRLHGGPGDGLNVAIDVESAEPPAEILYDPDAITVLDAAAGGQWPPSAAYYTRSEHAPGRPWDYRYVSDPPRPSI